MPKFTLPKTPCSIVEICPQSENGNIKYINLINDYRNMVSFEYHGKSRLVVVTGFKETQTGAELLAGFEITNEEQQGFKLFNLDDVEDFRYGLLFCNDDFQWQEISSVYEYQENTWIDDIDYILSQDEFKEVKQSICLSKIKVWQPQELTQAIESVQYESRAIDIASNTDDFNRLKSETSDLIQAQPVYVGFLSEKKRNLVNYLLSQTAEMYSVDLGEFTKSDNVLIVTDNELAQSLRDERIITFSDFVEKYS